MASSRAVGYGAVDSAKGGNHDDDGEEGIEMRDHDNDDFAQIDIQAYPQCGVADDDEGGALGGQDNVPPNVFGVFVTIPLFMGYAGMIVLQRNLKQRLMISDDDHAASTSFGVVVSLLYVGNLIFRAMHSFAFAHLAPRRRVLLSYALLSAAHFIIFTAYYANANADLTWAFFAYALAGIGIGTFESNVMSCLTPLGHGFKSWAVTGIPMGFAVVTIGFFLMFAQFGNSEAVQGFAHMLIACVNLGAIPYFAFGVPFVPFEASHASRAQVVAHLASFREWLPAIQANVIAFAIDMFAVSFGSALPLYIYSAPRLELWPFTGVVIDKSTFVALYNAAGFVGDVFMRRAVYHGSFTRGPLTLVCCTVLGLALLTVKVVLLAPLGFFFIMMANGGIYALSTKGIDERVPRQYNLTALSAWLFFGDWGAIVGSNLVPIARSAIGCIC